jgi:hypothetical protein
MKSFGLVISFGKWGGIYLSGFPTLPRLCLGWIAFTLFPVDGDEIIKGYLSDMERKAGGNS